MTDKGSNLPSPFQLEKHKLRMFFHDETVRIQQAIRDDKILVGPTVLLSWARRLERFFTVL